MIIRALVKKNSYYDSLVLMRMNSRVQELPGVVEAVVVMATEQNKRLLEERGLLTGDVARASAYDLVCAVAADTEEAAHAAVDLATELLQAQYATGTAGEQKAVRTLRAALQQQPAATLAILSIPGPYVKREALKALDAGLNLLIFSDNVPLEDEVELKHIARARDLLVMGPDCGTAMIQSAALAFANVVRAGRIGLVGASGTGLQEVATLIDRLGEGVSHAIGTGSRDVHEAVGGITMVQALRRLDADDGTSVIVLVSKPPHPDVARQVLQVVEECHKPVVVTFLDAGPELSGVEDGRWAYMLEEAAIKAVALLTGESESVIGGRLEEEAGRNREFVEKARAALGSEQKYVRGLFSGGTLAVEAAMVLRDRTGSLHTNFKLRGATPLPDPGQSTGHTCVDLGDDFFTAGRPHPMLEPRMRWERLLAEAADPETAVLLLDVITGYGAHPDPTGELARQVAEARQRARRALPVIASVCGVEADPQSRSTQIATLEAAGILVMPSNARAARLAADIVPALGGAPAGMRGEDG